jgi:hypothetical protein
MLHKTLISLAAAGVLACAPMATSALAAGHPAGSQARAAAPHPAAVGYAGGARVARSGGGYGGGYGGVYGSGYASGPVYNAPIYDSCTDGYGYGPGYECPGYGAPFVGGVINDILGGGQY